MSARSAATEIANRPRVSVISASLSPEGLDATCIIGYIKPVSNGTDHHRSETRRTPMLLRTTDPFRDFDRRAGQLLGTTNRPAVMPMDAWREGDVFQIEFDLPGVAKESIDLDVERNVLTVRAERVPRNGDWEMLASERPRGAFSRQLVLGDNLDLDRVQAHYDTGVLRLGVPVAEKAKPRKISIADDAGHDRGHDRGHDTIQGSSEPSAI